MHQKAEIIRSFLKKGYLLSEDAYIILEQLDWKTIYEIIPKSEKLKLLTKEEIIKIYNELSKTELKELKIEYLVDFSKKNQNEINIYNYYSIFKDRFNFLSSIIQKNYPLNYTTISKIKEKDVKKFNLIGMVLEVFEKSFILEDLTGSVEIIIENHEKPITDAVIGVMCKKENEKIYSEKIFYPMIFSQKNYVDFSIRIKYFDSFFVNENLIKLIEGFNIVRIFNSIFLFLSDKYENEIEKIIKTRIIPLDNKKLIEYKNDISLIRNQIDYVICQSEKNEYFSFNNIIIVKMKNEAIIEKDKVLFP